MTHLKVCIIAVDDPPPYEGKDIADAEFTEFVILEKGTDGGRTSVGFVFTLPDGKQVFCQTTARLMNMMYRAMLGALQRFGDTLD